LRHLKNYLKEKFTQIKKKLPLADEFGQYGVVGYELAVLVERADCVVQVDYEVLCAELTE